MHRLAAVSLEEALHDASLCIMPEHASRPTMHQDSLRIVTPFDLASWVVPAHAEALASFSRSCNAEEVKLHNKAQAMRYMPCLAVIRGHFCH